MGQTKVFLSLRYPKNMLKYDTSLKYMAFLPCNTQFLAGRRKLVLQDGLPKSMEFETVIALPLVKLK